MAFQTFTFDLELQPGGAPPVIYASAGDVGRPFAASLYWNGTQWSATGTTAVIRGKKPDKTVFDYSATVDGSSVTFSTTEQMTIISGPVECELVFTLDSSIVATANFILVVEESPFDPNAISESEVTGLNAMIQAATPEAVADWFENDASTSTTFTDAVGDAVADYAETNGIGFVINNGLLAIG